MISNHGRLGNEQPISFTKLHSTNLKLLELDGGLEERLHLLDGLRLHLVQVLERVHLLGADVVDLGGDERRTDLGGQRRLQRRGQHLFRLVLWSGSSSGELRKERLAELDEESVEYGKVYNENL